MAERNAQALQSVRMQHFSTSATTCTCNILVAAAHFQRPHVQLCQREVLPRPNCSQMQNMSLHVAQTMTAATSLHAMAASTQPSSPGVWVSGRLSWSGTSLMTARPSSLGSTTCQSMPKVLHCMHCWVVSCGQTCLTPCMQAGAASKFVACPGHVCCVCECRRQPLASCTAQCGAHFATKQHLQHTNQACTCCLFTLNAINDLHVYALHN